MVRVTDLQSVDDQMYATLHPFTYMAGQLASAEQFQTANLCLVKGSGVWAADSRNHWHFYATTAVPSVGLGNAEVIRRITQQYETLSFGSTCAQTHPLIEQLSRRLIAWTGEPFTQVFYSNDGSGAVETAMRLARQYHIAAGEKKRTKFISLEGNYHGTTFATGSVTHMGIRETFGPGLHDCHAAPAPNLFRPPIDGSQETVIRYCTDLLEELIFELSPNEVAAVLLEPIQGVYGIVPIPETFIRNVRAITEKYGILLIMDEVATGCGRTGSWTASQALGIQPDFLALSKGLTGGYFPMGATLIADPVKGRLFGEGGIFLHGSTQSGHPVGCAAALAVMDYIEEWELIENADVMGAHILDSLRSGLQHYGNVGDIRGKGMMLGIEFVKNKLAKEPVDYDFGERLSAALKREGVLGNWFNGTLLLYPPLTTTRMEADYLIQGVTKAVISLGME